MTKKKIYAIARGKKIGVFRSWEECSDLVLGYNGAVFKSFEKEEEAEKFIAENRITTDESIEEKEEKKEESKQGSHKETKTVTTEKEKEQAKETIILAEQEDEIAFQKEEEDEMEKWFDADGVESDSEEENNMSQAVTSYRKNKKKNNTSQEAGKITEEEKENGDDECGKCGKLVAQNAKAIQCWECKKWQHSHSKCGKELEWIYKMFRELLKEKEEEPEETLEWICRRCKTEKLNREKAGVEIARKEKQMLDTLGKQKEELELRVEQLELEKQQREDKMAQKKAEISVLKQKEQESRQDKTEIEKKNETIKQLTEELEREKEQRKLQKPTMDKQKKETLMYKELVQKTILEKSETERESKELHERLEEILNVNKDLEVELELARGRSKEIEKATIEETKKPRETRKNPPEADKDRDEERKQEDRRKTCLQYLKNKQCRFAEQCRFSHIELCKNNLRGLKCKEVDCDKKHDESVICRWNSKCTNRHCRFIHETTPSRRPRLERWKQGEDKGNRTKQYDKHVPMNIEQLIEKALESKVQEIYNTMKKENFRIQEVQTEGMIQGQMAEATT